MAAATLEVEHAQGLYDEVWCGLNCTYPHARGRRVCARVSAVNQFLTGQWRAVSYWGSPESATLLRSLSPRRKVLTDADSL